MAKFKGYKSDIVMGEEYLDKQTGLQGIATAVYFYQHGCERVNIETFDAVGKKIIATTFDAPRLTHVSTGKTAQVTRTGGPGNGLEAREDPAR
jgi:hypothetical protein